MADLPLETDPNLLVGRETSDDAGVYKLRDDLALIQTLDFFTPIVNDPYTFGQIAAVNALSDIYAMGGRPLTAMNIVCFPKKTLDKSVLKEILKGGLEKIHEAGALLIGGHSVDDLELKYGLSVTGIVHPDKVMTNAGARPGDRLILTKPIGTGIIATALKGKAASREAEEAMIQTMLESNRIGAEVMQEIGARACTDITGFGLLGHALEMASASQCSMKVIASQVPIIPYALEYSQMGMVPGGTHANRSFCHRSLQVDPAIPGYLLDILSDAQTSGGLLIAVSADRALSLLEQLKQRGLKEASLIGQVTELSPETISVLP
ncbi:MAG: selenide, water dikinase SelD [Deltaproteobacteria bacterium RBG_13_43_22]|nr:MAG: selenide, water dikinase SelD [Deltaproteobacteria bacterium RBG_13_43_22]